MIVASEQLATYVANVPALPLYAGPTHRKFNVAVPWHLIETVPLK